MNFTKYSSQIILSLVTILLSIGVWFAFYLNIPGKLSFPSTTLETIFANYDGPNYMVIAKCGYQKDCIGPRFSLPLPLEYYPAHLPGFPLLIKYLSFYVSTPKAMLLATLFGSLLLTLVTFSFFKLFLGHRVAFWLTLVSVFFPARLFVLRFVGAPEVWFIGFILLSVICYYRRQIWFSAVFASLALLFKSPGILLFIVYSYLAIRSKKAATFLPYLLIPFTGIAIFYVYYLQTGDFLAYFHSGDNIHLNLLPYLVFISNHTWINTIWLEDVIYIYLFAFYGLRKLYHRYRSDLVFLFPLVYTMASVFVAHRDISRYISPVYPFLLLAFAKVVSRHTSRLIFLILLPAILLYTVNFLIGNVAPISDWTPYL